MLLAVMSWLGGMGDAIAEPLLKPLLAPTESDAAADLYKYRTVHDPDGTGKVYLGREIAHYMGHRGAAWLERPDREVQEQPQRLIAALGLEPTDVVADIGAGTGYMSFRLATEVPEGTVLAVDIQPEMLDMLSFFQDINQIENVEPVLGEPDNPNLPDDQVDLVLMVDAYHEFEYPYEMMQGIVRSLKPNGRVVLVEYRGENWLLPIKRLHKMTEAQVKREMENVGLEWQETLEVLPQQHILIFSKPT
jgi:SAM-dependent methyltransferase